MPPQRSHPAGSQTVSPASVSSALNALGDFVYDNLKFFLDFGAMPQANGFIPPMDMTEMGAAAENRPVIGRFELEPDEALILEFEPPEGVYWSISLGNPWLETIHYGRHQSSLNGHQAVVDADGTARFVIAARDPGVANWLDTAGHSNGAMLLRCVRTESAPVPARASSSSTTSTRALPADTALTTPDERAESSKRAAAPYTKGSTDELLRRRTRRRRARRNRSRATSARPTTARVSSAPSTR